MDFSLPSLHLALTLRLCVRLLKPISPGFKFNAPALHSLAFKSLFSFLLILYWQHKVLNDQSVVPGDPGDKHGLSSTNLP